MRNKRILSLILMVMLAVFTLTACGSGGGGGKSDKPVISDVPQLAISTKTSVKKGGTVEVAVKLAAGTADMLETCGYQFALNYNKSIFSLAETVVNNSSDEKFDVNSKDMGDSIRVLAIPKTEDSVLEVTKSTKDQDKSENLVTFTFTANKTGSGDFSLGSTNFANVVSVYDNNKPMSLDTLTSGEKKTVSVT